MTDPLSLALAAATAGVALAAGWAHWPRPPALDGERWFKVSLATVLRGGVEAEGGSAESWEASVRRFVPFHPAGRWPERKVANPVAARLPRALIPGERALLDALARLRTADERWTWMYDQDEVGLAARLDDPVELGPAYDPAVRLGSGASWDGLAAWGGGDPRFGALLLARWSARWILVEGRPDRLAGPSVLPALEALLGDRAIRVPWEERPIDASQAALLATLRRAAPTVDVRLVVVGEEAGVVVALRALAEAADVRDQVHAVLSVGGTVGGRPDEPGPFGERDQADWLGARFTQQGMDTEVVRLTPYLAVQWFARPALGSAGLPIAAQRFPDPQDSVGVVTVEVVDLGVLPSESDFPVAQLAKALVAVVVAWVLSRR